MSKILMIYIEPTPYILGLIKNLIAFKKDQIDVLFLNVNQSQQWNVDIEKDWMILPKNFKEKIFLIRRLFFKNKYDVIHLAGWGHPLLLFFIMMAKLAGIPIVMESDTPLSQTVTTFWKRQLKQLLYPLLFRQIHLFLPGGTKQAKYFEYYGVASKQLIHAQMTVDVAAMQHHGQTMTANDRKRIREQYQFDEEQIIFLFVGRLEAHKGLTDLISAFRKIKNNDARLLFVGDGAERQKIQAEAHNQIRYAGRLSGQALIECYYAADVLVLPSYFEPWGLVVNEAMAFGKPVIVSDSVGCIDDLVIPYETGIIFPTGNQVELQNAMEYMANNQHERLKMGAQSAQTISSWTLENEAKNVYQAWNKLICI